MTEALQIDGFANLKKLGEERFLEIRNRLMRDEESMAVARLIQGDWKELIGVKERTLAQQLNRLKLKMQKGALGVDHQKRLASGEQVTLKQLRGTSVDPMEELNALCSMQRNRLQTFLEKEKSMPVPLNSVGELMRDFRLSLVDLQKMRFERGVDSYRAPMSGTKGFSITKTAPDGSSTNVQVVEAMTMVQEILKRRNIDMSDVLPPV